MIGLPDDEAGEIPAAFVVLKPGQERHRRRHPRVRRGEGRELQAGPEAHVRRRDPEVGLGQDPAPRPARPSHAVALPPRRRVVRPNRQEFPHGDVRGPRGSADVVRRAGRRRGHHHRAAPRRDVHGRHLDDAAGGAGRWSPAAAPGAAGPRPHGRRRRRELRADDRRHDRVHRGGRRRRSGRSRRVERWRQHRPPRRPSPSRPRPQARRHRVELPPRGHHSGVPRGHGRRGGRGRHAARPLRGGVPRRARALAGHQGEARSTCGGPARR